jgi:hypothetical protein
MKCMLFVFVWRSSGRDKPLYDNLDDCLKAELTMHHSGIFHPKNIFLLLESQPGEDGSRERALLTACLRRT